MGWKLVVKPLAGLAQPNLTAQLTIEEPSR